MSGKHRARKSSFALEFETVEARLLLTAEATGAPDLVSTQQTGSTGDSPALAAQSAQTDAITGLANVRNQYGFYGAGQTVAIIDSGIDYLHPALGGGLGTSYRVVGGWDFSGQQGADPNDAGPAGGHGTHVAGIIGSSDPTALGVAPQVDFVGLRVFDSQGNGSFDQVDEALRWIHEHRNAFEFPITTVNISLGTDWNSETVPNWANLENDLRVLEEDGIFIAVAAGNGFRTSQTVGLSYPAASQYVVPVAAVDTDHMAAFSQRDDRVLVAPGQSVLSTVPDYLGNGDGKQNDFARLSGTSMAAPYVAGASVLVREALTLAGRTAIDQETIYNLLYSTADLVHDSVTGADYHRVNLARALADTLPDDDPGQTHDLGTLAGQLSDDGLLVGGSDHDRVTFTATESGLISVRLTGSGNLKATGSIAGATAQGDSFTLEAVAGQRYTLDIGGSGGAGHYHLDVSLQSPPVDWGLIGSNGFYGQSSSGDAWQTITASREGTLTVDAFFAAAAGVLRLELYDAAHQRIGTSADEAGHARLDANVHAGQQYYVHTIGTQASIDYFLNNIVTRDGSAVDIYGTIGDDSWQFTAGSTLTVSINGLVYKFARGDVSQVRVHSLGGSDSLGLTGSSGSDSLRASGSQLDLSGAGYAFTANNIVSLKVDGGGGIDRAELSSAGLGDIFTASPGAASLRSSNFQLLATRFSDVLATTTGNLGRAILTGSATNDQLTATGQQTQIIGGGSKLTVRGFESVAVRGNGGSDDAYLAADAGNSQLAIAPSAAQLTTHSIFWDVAGFRTIRAQASGNDNQAVFSDSLGDDQFVGRVGQAQLSGSGYQNTAFGFDQVRVRSQAGHDRAIVSSLNSGGTFTVAGTTGQLVAGSASLSVRGFETLQATGGRTERAVVVPVDGSSLATTGSQQRYAMPGATTVLSGFGASQLAAADSALARESIAGLAVLADHDARVLAEDDASIARSDRAPSDRVFSATADWPLV